MAHDIHTSQYVDCFMIRCALYD